MKFKFDGNQEFQLIPIRSVVRLFEGQPKKQDLPLLMGEYGVFGNNLNITTERVFENLQQIQEENNIPFELRNDSLDFSIEMETGTGKTYTYLRTVFELNVKYGWTKFIIIVPSISIKEGVLKSYQITKDHFEELYSSVVSSCYEYDSRKPNQVKSFGRDTHINIMVMTLHSFNKETNVIKQNDLDGFEDTPISYIQKARPVVILDEPQNMESDLSKKSIAELNPLFTLRYSGTHKNYYNLLYRLSPYESYQRGLVKKIEVVSMKEKFNFNKPHIRVIEIGKDNNKNKPFYANIECFVKDRSGEVSVDIITIRQGDRLERKTKNSIYEGYRLMNIMTSTKQIEFENHQVFSQGEDNDASKKEIQKLQIEKTIRLHFDKQQEFIDRGLDIKVLSLFFIDRVDNYVNDGWIKEEFEKLFDEIKLEYEHFKMKDKSKVHNGYFSKKVNKKSGEITYKDELGNNKTDREIEKDVYNLIMRDKEKLLSFEEETCFIFSHSALKEGWDNPNVFQISTLNETVSDIKKRQEIGRGLRLSVNSDGSRVFDKKINVLSVVSNESYEEFVSRLQTEYENEFFKGEKKITPDNGNNKRPLVKLKKDVLDSKEFKELWERISTRTRYKIEFDSDELIDNCIDTINDTVEINEIVYQIDTFEITMSESSGVGANTPDSGIINTSGYTGDLPNLIEELKKETNLTTISIKKILEGLDDYLLEDFIRNPQDFIYQVSKVINNEKREFLLSGIEYEELKDENGAILYYDQSLFADLTKVPENKIVDIVSDKSVYDSIVVDSDNERDFTKHFVDNPNIKLFVKLPSKFHIPTPIGNYNPDWGYIKEEKNPMTGKLERTLYFVGETKTSQDELDLRAREWFKIKCAEHHFEHTLRAAPDAEYKVLTKTSQV
ncbi:DEAD/DEAH box helicase family protein [Sulfurovum sp. TSL1]|uniref:restriction endonuclease n=1 Tax=Sulfurovum sp. TSL1 TaxID=2826994 RepID=UPI001CC4C0EB|nr:DEAD/DEAH box helicase family protein [Sulfurovum sp. TSL1]GIT98517.1 type III restriction endonuclease subunit R [Sulfurovum sp. TSL1]